MVLVDVEHFGDPERTDHHRLSVRDGVYGSLASAFAEAHIPWQDCEIHDCGDGAMVLVPAQVSKSRIVQLLPDQLVTALAKHNADREPKARVRLRLALHAGEVHHDERGPCGDALNFAFRLLDAVAAKQLLALSSGLLVVIASELLYQGVIRHDPEAAPGEYRQVGFTTKETQSVAWLRIPGDGEAFAVTPPGPDARMPVSVGNGRVEHSLEDQLKQVLAVEDRRFPRAPRVELVDALLAVPLLAQESGRQLVLSHLRPALATAVPYYPQARLHVFSLLNTCVNYRGGFEELLSVVRLLEGDSIAVTRLDDIVADLLSRPRE